jgi:hypothetical protein
LKSAVLAERFLIDGGTIHDSLAQHLLADAIEPFPLHIGPVVPGEHALDCGVDAGFVRNERISIAAWRIKAIILTDRPFAVIRIKKYDCTRISKSLCTEYISFHGIG